LADNIPVAGKTIATDEVTIGGATVHVQRTKLGYGADGTYTGDVSPSTPLPVADDVRATGGASMHHRVATATDNVNVKSSAGTVYGVTIANELAAMMYLKLFNSASAPTLGSGTPVITLACAAGVTNTEGGTASYQFPKGLAFSSGIGFTLGLDEEDASASAVTADKVVINIQYK